jgi:hypothetical protein
MDKQTVQLRFNYIHPKIDKTRVLWFNVSRYVLNRRCQISIGIGSPFLACGVCFEPGLPDGFSNQKSQFGSILEGLRLVNFDIFYGHLE